MNNVLIGAVGDNGTVVRLEKWIVGDKSYFYIIVDKTDEPIDGFSRKYSALDAIKRWGLKLKKGPIKIRA